MAIDIITSDHQKNVYLCIDGDFVLTKDYTSTRRFMEDLCLKNGTLLEGCYEASRILLDNVYKRPIYIGGVCNKIYVPTSSFKSSECTWISLDFLLNNSLHNFNSFGYETISEKRWQKHLLDGINLQNAIFRKETF